MLNFTIHTTTEVVFGRDIEEQIGLKVDKKKIVIADPIKMVGTRHVTAKLHPEVSAEITVIISEG